MNNFEIMHRLLATLEKQMDYPRPDPQEFSAEALNISTPRWNEIMRMLDRSNQIKGLQNGGDSRVDASNVRITLHGLEELSYFEDQEAKEHQSEVSSQQLRDLEEKGDKNIRMLDNFKTVFLICAGVAIGYLVSVLI